MNSSILVACVMLFFSGCIAGGLSSQSSPKILEGRAYFSGSEPNLQLMVESGDEVYCVSGLSLEEQQRLQDQQAQFEGSLVDGFCRDGGGRVFAVSNYTLIQ